jgi:3-oxoacyl-[acyl-carrier protein] reductase
VNNSSQPVALITGARTGIGRFLCEHLLRQGYCVVGCSRNPTDLQAEGFDFVQADVTSEQQVKALFRVIQEKHGRLDVAINNAGAANMNHSLLMPLATFQRLMETNVQGMWLVSREAAKMMRKHKYGRIINFSSAANPIRLAGEAAYIAAKSAVESLSQVMAREVYDYGITINVVGPAPVPTEMIRGVPQEKIDRLLEMMPVRRLCTFEDVANVIDFFLLPASSAITAQVIYLGGVPNR